MTSMELTKEHLSKLLEMCKVLFPDQCPEYMSEIAFSDCQGMLYFYEKGKLSKGVHWFEFCIYTLSYKILHEKNEGDVQLCWIETLQQKNIVEYLYSKFKK